MYYYITIKVISKMNHEANAYSHIPLPLDRHKPTRTFFPFLSERVMVSQDTDQVGNEHSQT